ncbi:ADP-ribose pyrophosphatase [Sporobacter termitidis DSM 10068]|uniref:ADP-ribose pyrophosphatase n=1 Tax=Sporobacter termitidis DSM 10068 TaxID=1123282 RepID=A0A1M5UPR0_9FIRM|nr:NUDIX hydrolase [Sporobacter termitidis]SHH64633.1 ADP-ribose pyrophosphatase [Sporobacter termitidis DSM 10068]
MEFFEKQVSTNTVYKGRIVNVRNDVAELHNGALVPREVVEHPGGVAIVPVTAAGDVLMVRQYRYPMGEELLEIPAGKLEYCEDHRDCAVRELSEETGYTAGKLVYLGPVYTSPGFSMEILHIYLAMDLIPGQAHPDENEFLTVEAVPLPALAGQIMSGDIRDAKTIIGILKAEKYLERNR